MKHLTILSYSLMQQCVDSFLAVAANLQKKGFQVEHIGVTDFSTLPTVRKITYEAYCQSLRHVYVLPSFDHPDFVHHVDKILAKHSPDVFLTDNERIIAVFLTHYLHEKGVPSLMVDHGYLSKPPMIYENPRCKFIKQKLDWITGFRIEHAAEIKQKVNLLMKYPPGRKSEQLICAMNELNRDHYLQYGVPQEKVILTGFPYFDQVFALRKIAKKKRGKKKILIVSSGLGMLSGQKKDAEEFTQFVIAIARQIGDEYELTLRFKPGENIFSMLSVQTARALRACKIKFDDARKKSYQVASDHDLVMGDPSFVLLEAIIIGKPVMLIHYRKVLPSDRKGDEFVRKITGALILENPREIHSLLRAAFSSKYRQALARNMKRNEHDLFYKLDDYAATRVADVVIRAVSRAKTSR